MENVIALENAGRQYAEAYAAHYVARDLPLALQHYKRVLASHPNTREAGYSRTQVQNIVNTVIPKHRLLEAQMQLAVARFEREGLLEE